MKTVAFWHCFGPYGKETRAEILDRKREEIARNKWTLWSFSHRPDTTLVLWLSQIKSIGAKRVFVLCSASKNAKNRVNGKKELLNARKYRNPLEQKWNSIPAEIKVPHFFGSGSSTGSAFKVKDILLPPADAATDGGFKWLEPELPTWRPRPAVKFQWLSVKHKDGKWKKHKKPSQLREYLVKEGKGVTLQSIHAILELQYPYVVQICKMKP
jgi:hypothetical protein